MVERYIRDVEVAGSNPVASIFFVQNPRIWFVLGFFLFSALYTKQVSCVTMPMRKNEIYGDFKIDKLGRSNGGEPS